MNLFIDLAKGMGYRSKNEIIGQILKAANGGATKTMIMYKAFLNFNQQKEYLTGLIGDDLLSYDRQTRTFKTTERGLHFLDKYNRIEAMIKEEEEQPIPSQEQMWI
jgi:predicted transcriptional regulator